MRTLLLSALLCRAAFGAALPEFYAPLDKAEAAALAHSPKLRAAELDAEAARHFAKSQRAALLPRITLDGAAKYASEVPALSLPGIGQRKLGDNWNYSIGPSLAWTAWDKNALRYGYFSADSLAQSKEKEAEAVRRDILLRARTAYLRVELALEDTVLLSDSLKLEQAQYEDIRLNVKAGTKSKIDQLLSHQEVLARKKQLLKARAALAEALDDLFSLTGFGAGLDTALALDARAAHNALPDTEPPSLIVRADALDAIAARLEYAKAAEPDLSHPSIAALAKLADSLRMSSKSFQSDKWPKIQLTARSSRDYPNGPVLESFNQNTAGISLSMPLFESGRSDERAAESGKKAESSDKRAEQARDDLLRDFGKAKDRLRTLAAQQELNARTAEEAKELAGLTYESYRAGRSTYLELQTANLRELDAGVQTAETEVQILMELAILASLSK